MGYDTTIYFLDKTSLKSSQHPGRFHGILHGMCELHVCPDIARAFHDGLGTYTSNTSFFRPGDGNTEVTHDAYEDPIQEMSLEEFEDVLIKAIKEEPNYIHLRVALAMTQTYKLSHKNMVVIHYGH